MRRYNAIFFIILHTEGHKVLPLYEYYNKLTLLHFSFLHLHPLSLLYFYELG